MILLVTCLLAQAAPAAGPYDSDPEHLWNRLHRAIHGWEVRHLDPEPASDSLHWPADPSDIAGLAQMSLSKLLEEFLTRNGQDRVKDPIKRAVLQRDLWMVFDWSLSTEQGGTFWDLHAGKEATVDRGNHRDLRKKIAAALRRVALSADEIAALPDTYAAAAQAYAGKAGPKPGNPFLPADLLDPKGPWVVLGNDAGGPLALSHEEFFRGRASFLVLLNLSGDRRETEAYVRKISGWPRERSGDLPECPNGTEVALVRQSMLIDDHGSVLRSPLTESVQLRILRKGVPEPDQSESIKFLLHRANLFGGKAGGLVPDDRDFSYTLFLGNQKDNHRIFVIDSCRECHKGSSIASLETVLSVRRKFRAILVPTTWESEIERNLEWTRDRFSFGQLKALWPD